MQIIARDSALSSHVLWQPWNFFNMGCEPIKPADLMQHIRPTLTGTTSIEAGGQLSSPWVEADGNGAHVHLLARPLREAFINLLSSGNISLNLTSNSIAVEPNPFPSLMANVPDVANVPYTEALGEPTPLFQPTRQVRLSTLPPTSLNQTFS